MYVTIFFFLRLILKVTKSLISFIIFYRIENEHLLFMVSFNITNKGKETWIRNLNKIFV